MDAGKEATRPLGPQTLIQIPTKESEGSARQRWGLRERGSQWVMVQTEGLWCGGKPAHLAHPNHYPYQSVTTHIPASAPTSKRLRSLMHVYLAKCQRGPRGQKFPLCAQQKVFATLLERHKIINQQTSRRLREAPLHPWTSRYLWCGGSHSCLL